MRLWLLVGVLSVLTRAAHGEEWRPLFNGRDLTGWRANNDPDSFRATEGTIRVQSTASTSAHLFVVNGETGEPEKFRNFELELWARAEPNSNGGVFVHTDMSTRDAALHLARGYEVQLNSSQKEKRKTGSLYAIVDYDHSPLDETKWFRVNIIVDGKRIRILIDGKQTVDYTEPENAERPPQRKGRLFSPDGGAIALQAHDRKSVWYFRDVRIRPLP
ncbi:hypothetical protein Pan44_44790 [Caulifigura coniformis]|uniref:3-keto-alpha-glucoside-1,2-lyase/3-keto-2-hydroxy-glucal hydratase domain-containing protein n=1 Tax=Caulifigura coniformis TaxID=2527983 RepID=A0A517SJW8_9PLAN|nr:DUF1080 domain-containing protein [Caulifigura coniformis]QDT56425.1 hypothetical protein Pan44_44790 [Caulifigura coniformis]